LGVSNYKGLLNHVGHDIECVIYERAGEVWNVAIECVTCGEVLLDFDAEHKERATPTNCYCCNSPELDQVDVHLEDNKHKVVSLVCCNCKKDFIGVVWKLKKW